jgi:hypothetical protein
MGILRKNNENLSLPKSIVMYGVEIKKMPCGRYFEALQTLKDLPQNFIQAVFEGKEVKFSELMSIDKIVDLFMKLIATLPDFTVSFLSKLMDIDEEVIRNDITPLELVKIIKKFAEINELESFFDEMKPVMMKMKSMVQKIGFKEPLQSVSKLESVKKNS